MEVKVGHSKNNKRGSRQKFKEQSYIVQKIQYINHINTEMEWNKNTSQKWTLHKD